MRMFRQCESGWSHIQFGNFCQLLLANSTNTDIEYFATFSNHKIPSHRLPAIADALEELTTNSAFIEDRQVETMAALVAHMRQLAADGLDLEYR